MCDCATGITQLKAQEPPRTCNEGREEEKKCATWEAKNTRGFESGGTLHPNPCQLLQGKPKTLDELVVCFNCLFVLVEVFWCENSSRRGPCATVRQGKPNTLERSDEGWP